MAKTLEDLAKYVNGEHLGENVTVYDIAGLPYAKKGFLSFIEDKKKPELAETCEASALITPLDMPDISRPSIRVKNPRLAFAKILALFHPARVKEPGIHPTACLGENVSVGKDVYIGPYVVIGDNVDIGDRCQLRPFVYLDSLVTIGEDTTLHPRVCIMRDCHIGKRVSIHSGTVIGADGFGYVKDGNKHIKIPQIGKVLIGDDVEIGANVTIDRATTDSTRIGRGTKIDNLIQIGHNTVVGEDCIIVSQSGLAGSITVGDRVVIAAQAGIRDHVVIGSDSIIAGRAGVTKSVPSGILVSGYPARLHREELKIEAVIKKLPEIAKKVRELEKKLVERREKSEPL